MTTLAPNYAQNNIITFEDYNLLALGSKSGVNVNTNPNITSLSGAGDGNIGYGQTSVTDSPTIAPLSAKIQGSKVTSYNEWTSLVNNLNVIASHQGTVLTPITPPISGDLVQFYSSLENNIQTVWNNRLNASQQGESITYQNWSRLSFTRYLNFYFTIKFISQYHARWFFNSGGQLCISGTQRTATTNDIYMYQVMQGMGKIFISSPVSPMTATIDGTVFNGVTRIDGEEIGTRTLNSNIGFYNFTTNWLVLFTQRVSKGQFCSILAKTNSTKDEIQLLIYAYTPNGLPVNTQGTETTINLNVIQPETTNFKKSYGQIAVTYSVTK